jgi:myo-inositol-1-phosphate synthase
MGFTITTEDDERLWHAYREQRDAVRSVMGQGVYPNLVKALETYAAFDAALANGLSDPDLLEYHASTMQIIAPYIAQLRQLATGMTQIMVAIETAQPGAFGIQLPVQEPE